jgi:hypothetical protein
MYLFSLKANISVLLEHGAVFAVDFVLYNQLISSKWKVPQLVSFIRRMEYSKKVKLSGYSPCGC